MKTKFTTQQMALKWLNGFYELYTSESLYVEGIKDAQKGYLREAKEYSIKAIDNSIECGVIRKNEIEYWKEVRSKINEMVK